MSALAARRHDVCGFTLVEVLVALVIVAFGMGAVLSALSAAAANVSALREKTLAQWVALNQVADTRLNLQAPATGTTQGDLKNFGNGDWHWQQDITALTQIPGLLQITVSVRRYTADSASTAKASATATAPSWLATVIGFRGTAVAAANGEIPDWTGTSFSGTSSSGSSGGSTSGNVLNPGTGTTPSTPLTPATPGGTSSSSSGGN
jgi:general secretion pathway protein I